MKLLISRRYRTLGLYAAAVVVAVAVIVVSDSSVARLVVLAILIGTAGILQIQVVLSVRDLMANMRRESKTRHNLLLGDIETRTERLATLADPTKQANRLSQARDEVADLATSLERREQELSELGESLRRIEFELTLANSQGNRDTMSRYDGTESANSTGAEDR